MKLQTLHSLIDSRDGNLSTMLKFSVKIPVAQWRIQDFPEREDISAIIWQTFPRKQHENEKDRTQKGDACPYDPTMLSLFASRWHFVLQV